MKSNIKNENSRKANNYYISFSEGNDNNSGLSKKEAWKTLCKVSRTLFQQGDIIRLNCDDIWKEPLNLNGSGTRDNPIILESYNTGEKPLIQYHDTVLKLRNQSGWIIRDIALNCTSVESVTVNGGPNQMWDTNPACICLEFSGLDDYSDITIDNNELYGQGVNCNGQGIFVHHLSHTINQLVLNRLTVSNNNIHDVGTFGFYSTAAWRGIGQTRYPNYSDKLFRNVRLVDNIIHDTGIHGMILSQANNSAIKRNHAYNIAQATVPDMNWGPCGLWTMITSYVDIMFNEVHDMCDTSCGFDGCGFDIDWVSDHVNLQYNFAHDCEGPGIETMTNTNCTIKNNKMASNGWSGNPKFNSQLNISDFQWGGGGNMVPGVRNLIIENNLLLVDKDNPHSHKNYALQCQHIDEKGKWLDNSISNNRIVFKETLKFPRCYKDFSDAAGINKLDSNKFFSADGERFHGEYNDEVYQSLEEWQQATGMEQGSSAQISKCKKPSMVSHILGKPHINPMGIQLSWEDLGESIFHYNIYRSTIRDFSPNYRNMVGESADASFFDTEEVKKDTVYYYIIEAEDYCGNTGQHSLYYEIKTQNGIPYPWNMADTDSGNNIDVVCNDETIQILRQREEKKSDTDDCNVYLFSTLDGDAALEAKLSYCSEGTAGLQFRNTLDTNSPYTELSINSEGVCSLNYCEKEKLERIVLQENVKFPCYIKLERNNILYSAYLSYDGNEWIWMRDIKINIGNSYTAILFSNSNEAKFDHVTLNHIRGGERNFIINAGFEAELPTLIPTAWRTWDGASGTGVGASYTEKSNNAHGGCNCCVHSNKDTEYEVLTYQTINGLKDGVYTLNAWVKSSGGQIDCYMEVKEYGGKTLRQEISPNEKWFNINIPEIMVIDGKCTIGFYSKSIGGNWMKFDDVEFCVL